MNNGWSISHETALRWILSYFTDDKEYWFRYGLVLSDSKPLPELVWQEYAECLPGIECRLTSKWIPNIKVILKKRTGVFILTGPRFQLLKHWQQTDKYNIMQVNYKKITTALYCLKQPSRYCCKFIYILVNGDTPGVHILNIEYLPSLVPYSHNASDTLSFISCGNSPEQKLPCA